MAEVTRAFSKTKFQTGDVPTQTDFEDLHDSVPFHKDAVFTSMAGTGWDGSWKYDMIGMSKAYTFSTSRRSGVLHIKQNGVGGHSITLNGIAANINVDPHSQTVISFFYNDVLGQHVFMLHKDIIGNISGGGGGGDTTPPTIVFVEALDAHTIRVIFSETPVNTNGFTFNNGGALTISGASIAGVGDYIDYTITQTMTSSDTITWSYTPGNIQDGSGNMLAAGSGGVTNSISGGGGIDADAQAYIDAEELAASVTIPSGHKTAIGNLVTALKGGANAWGQWKAIYLFYGTGLRNLKDPANTDAAFRLIQGTGTDVTFANGVGATYNGANYLRSRVIPNSDLGTNSMSLFAHVKGQTGSCALGTLDSTDACYLFADSGGSALHRFVADRTLGTETDPMTVMASVRNPSTGNWSERALLNGVEVQATSGSGNYVGGSFEILLGCLNNNNTPAAFLTGNMGMACIGLELSNTQMNESQTAFAAFITATGR